MGISDFFNVKKGKKSTTNKYAEKSVDTVNINPNKNTSKNTNVNTTNNTSTNTLNTVEEIKQDENLNKENEAKNSFCFFKKKENKKLVILFVENTQEVAKYKESILKNIKDSVSSNNLVCVIRYNSKVEHTSINEPAHIRAKDFLCPNTSENEICMYDAINKLKEVVDLALTKEIEEEEKIYTVDSIEIIGIGTCLDNCSFSKKKQAILNFYRLSGNYKVKTKYLCLSEDYFINAAEVGFHLIESIKKE